MTNFTKGHKAAFLKSKPIPKNAEVRRLNFSHDVSRQNVNIDDLEMQPKKGSKTLNNVCPKWVIIVIK